MYCTVYHTFVSSFSIPLHCSTSVVVKKDVYASKAAETAVKVPFLVKVSISDLNIRKGPGTDYDRVQFIPIGVYTIMEVRSGKGSSAGWGRLKSGIGWIS